MPVPSPFLDPTSLFARTGSGSLGPGLEVGGGDVAWGPTPSHAWPGAGPGDTERGLQGTFKHALPGLLNDPVGKRPPQNHGDWFSCSRWEGVGGGLM